jgi:hypothetical protein
MIYLLLPYFGTFPNYFQLYLDSVANNQDILRVVLITDIDTTQYTIPPNVVIVHKTLDTLRERASQLFVDDFNKYVKPKNIIKTLHKLTDFKPINHVLFSDVVSSLSIQPTDYIGWCDCDVILGKLTHFIDLSKQYDIIGRKGHFTAFRMYDSILSLYKRIDMFVERLMMDQCMYVDENQFVDLLMDLSKEKNLTYLILNNSYCDIQPWQWMLNESKELTMAGRPNEIIKHLSYDKTDGRLFVYFEDGRVQEASYAHLQKRAMRMDFKEYQTKFYIKKASFELTE